MEVDIQCPICDRTLIDGQWRFLDFWEQRERRYHWRFYTVIAVECCGKLSKEEQDTKALLQAAFAGWVAMAEFSPLLWDELTEDRKSEIIGYNLERHKLMFKRNAAAKVIRLNEVVIVFARKE